MGISYSIISYPAGQSIINRVYKTNIHLSLCYSAYDKKYYLQTWQDEPSLCNPIANEGHLRLPIGIKFKITNVCYQPGLIDSGPSFRVNIQFLDNIAVSDISGRIRKNPRKRAFLNYEHVNVKSIYGDKIEELIEKDLLLLKNFNCNLFTHEFFPYDYCLVDKQKPLHPNDLITMI